MLTDAKDTFCTLKFSNNYYSTAYKYNYFIYIYV